MNRPADPRNPGNYQKALAGLRDSILEVALCPEAEDGILTLCCFLLRKILPQILGQERRNDEKVA